MPVVSKQGETRNAPAPDGLETIRPRTGGPPSFLENLNKEGGMSANTPEKPLLDASMVILFPLLMADRHTGNIPHEILGVLFTGAFLLHTWLNRHWYGTLFKGPYPPARSIRALLNILLLLFFVGTLASAAVISKSVFSFLGFKGELFSRTLHIFFAHWSFLLAAVHLGLYWKKMSATLNRYALPPHSCRHKALSPLIGIVIASYGAYVFIQRELAYPLTMRSAFMAWSENDGIPLFLLDYGAAFFLCAWAASALSRLIPKKSGPFLCPAGNWEASGTK